MNDSKYVVFKRDKYWEEVDKSLDQNFTEIELEDAIVIRMQDRFSAIALQSYFDAVSNALEIIVDLGFTGSKELRDLEALRDWAFNITQEAREYKDKKIPDPQ